MDKIVSKRLIMRKLSLDDTFDMFSYAKLDNVGPNAGWQPHKSELETKKTIEWMIKSDEVWGIIHKESNRLIGTIGLHKKEHKDLEKEIGYVLNPSYWHQGYMIEAVKALIMYSFDHLGLEKLHCAHFIDNISSQKVIDKAGFKRVGTAKTTINLYGFQVTRESIQYEIPKALYERKQLPWQQR